MVRICVISTLLMLPLSSVQAQEDACEMNQQMINWSQPNNVPITNNNATRWPIDASIRIAYSGLWCPSAEDVELVKLPKEGDPVAVAATIRIKTPHKIVTNGTTPLTVMEIDPVDNLEKRTDYRVTVRPPNPTLAIYREFVLEFRTKVGVAAEFPDFEGVTSVQLGGDRCLEGSAFYAADEPTRPCPRPNRLKLAVEFQPLDRPEIAYVVYRTSSVEISEDGMGKGSGRADLTPIRVAFENGVQNIISGDGQPPVRKTSVYVPYYPLPRRDCFSVRAIDEYGRERGDVMNEKCVDLFPLAPCPDGCDPMAMMCQVFPTPMEAEAADPQPGQECAPVGLNGAEATDEVPEVGQEPSAAGGSNETNADSMGGQSTTSASGGTQGSGAAGGALAAQTGSTSSKGGGMCSSQGVGTQAQFPWTIALAFLSLAFVRRQRR